MSELEYVGKIKGMKTLKQMIGSKDTVPASQLEKNRAEEDAKQKAFEESVRAEESHRKTKTCNGKVQGVDLWTRERFTE